MAANLSFTQNGATPNAASSILSSFQKPNPVQSALTAMQKPVIPATPTPTTPVKSVSVAHPDGTTITSTYHPEVPQGTNSGLINSGDAQVKANQEMAAKLGISIPGVGGGSSLLQSPQSLQTSAPANFNTAPNQSVPSVNYQTPSGATVNSQGGLVTAPAQQISPPVTYPGLISQLAQNASQPSQSYTDAMKQAEDINRQLAESKANLAKELSLNAQNPIPLEFQQGRGQIITQQGLAQQGALSSELQGASNLAGVANTQQQTQQTGLTSAANLAQPQLAGFNQQSFDPLTGQFGTGASGGTALSQLPSQAQTAIQSYAKQVKNGQMTRSDAESRLSAYGVAGINALNELLGPEFNTNASNASGKTTETGQLLQTSAKSALQALDKLETDFSTLSLGAGNFPIANEIEQWLGNKFGSGTVATYQSTLHDARAQLQGVLTASGAVTPTGAEQMAQAYLPDGMTPAQLKAKIEAAKALIAQKVSSFTQSGQQNNQNTTTTSATVTAGGYNFKQDTNGNWVPA